MLRRLISRASKRRVRMSKEAADAIADLAKLDAEMRGREWRSDCPYCPPAHYPYFKNKRG